jgi:hypothetical protein
MGGVAEPELAAAVSQAGGLGILGHAISSRTKCAANPSDQTGHEEAVRDRSLLSLARRDSDTHRETRSLPRSECRRKWSAAIVAESLASAVVAEVAHRHGVPPQHGMAQTCSRAEQPQRPGTIARCNAGIRSSRAAGCRSHRRAGKIADATLAISPKCRYAEHIVYITCNIRPKRSRHSSVVQRQKCHAGEASQPIQAILNYPQQFRLTLRLALIVYYLQSST